MKTYVRNFSNQVHLNDFDDTHSFSIDEQQRINIGRKNAGKEVRFFAHIKDGGEIKKSDSLISFPRENYAEIRRVRGENLGLPLTVNSNGTVWAGDRFINIDLKIFIRRDRE